MFIFHSVVECIFTIAKKRNVYRRWWVKPHLRENVRRRYGAFATLFSYFKEYDEEEYYKLLHVTVDQFNDLHKLLKSRLTKSNIRRRSIPSEIRLAMTLQ